MLNSVAILTRHDTHVTYTARALQGPRQAVFVEKPLAIDREQLAQLQRVYAAHCRLAAPHVCDGGLQPPVCTVH